MKPTIIRVLISLGMIFCLLIGLTAIGLFYLNSRHATLQLQRLVNDLIPGQVSWGKQAVSPMKGKLEIRHLLIQGVSGKKIVEIDRVFTHFSLIDLFQRRLVVSELVVEGPRVDIAVEPDGALDLIRAFSPPSEKAQTPDDDELSWDIPVVIESLKLADGALKYETGQGSWVFAVGRCNILASVNLFNQAGSASISITEGFIEGPDQRYDIDRLDLSADYHDFSVDKIMLEAASGSSRLRAQGKIFDMAENPIFDADIHLETPLERIEQQFKLRAGLSGEAVAQLRFSGPLGNPEARLDIQCGRGTLFERPIDGVDMRIDLKDRLASIKQADIRAFSGIVKILGHVDFKPAFARGFLSDPVDIDKTTYSLSLLHQEIDIARLFSDSADVGGSVDGKVLLSGRGFSLAALFGRAELEIQGNAVTTGPFQDPSDWHVQGRAELADQKAQLHELAALSGDLKLHCAGTVDFHKDQMIAGMQLHLPDVRTVLAPLGLESQGNLDIKIDASGSLRRPVLALRIDGGDLAVSDISLGDLRIDGELTPDGKIKFGNVRVKNGESEIRATGTMKLFEKDFKLDRSLPLSVNVDVHRFKPAVFFKDNPIAGEISGRVTAQGPLYDLTASLELGGKNLALEAFKIGDADAKILFDKGRLVVGRAKLVNGKSAIDITGDIALFTPGTFTVADDPGFSLDLKAGALSANDFYDKAKGVFTLEAKGGGSLKDPVGHVKLVGTDIVFDGFAVKKIQMTSTVADNILTVGELGIFPDKDSYINGSGWISLEKDFAFVLASRGIKLSQFPWIKKTQPIAGEIFMDISGAGSFENPEITGLAGISGVRANGKPLPDVSLSLDVRDHEARIKASPGFDVAGVYNFSQNTFSATAGFENTDLSPILSFFDQPRANGTLNGTVRVAGKAGDPQSYTGSMDFDRITFFFSDHAVVHSGHIRLSLSEQVVSIAGFHLDLSDGKALDVYGKIDQNGLVSLKAKGEIPLSMMQMFSADFADAEGNAFFEANIQGDFAHPEVVGEIRLADVSATLPFLSQNLKSVNGTVRLTPEKIFVDALAGQLDEGRFSIVGNMAMDGLSPAELTLDIHADALPIRIPDTMDIVINADLIVRGMPENARLNGSVTLVEGTYYKDVNLSLFESAVSKRRKTSPIRAEISAPYVKNMALNVVIKHRNPFVVDNNLAQMEIVPDLKLTGTLNRPVINGRADIQTGTVVYRKRVFTIDKGVIDFLNPYIIEPTLTVESSSRIRDWLISLTISGTPDELDFTLSSDPALDDGNILSLMLTGRTTSEMILSEGGSTQSAAQMLGQILASKMDDDIKRTMGLDIFEAEINGASGGQSAGEVKVTIGKELSTRMSVKYSMETVKGEMVQKALAEYKFFKDILVSGFQDNRGSFGGSIKYRLEFR